MQPIKAIVIGGGLNSAAGAAHRAALRLSGRFNIIDGFFSRDKEINDQSRVVWGVQATSKNDSSLSAFIERISTEDIDLAIVLSPTPHHYEVIKTLMLAGLNVVSEKSITMTSEECMHIDKLRRDLQKFIRVTFNYSGYPMVRELISRVKRGDIGNLQQIRCEMPQEGFVRPPLIAGIKSPPQAWRLIDGLVPTVCHDLGVHMHHLTTLISGSNLIPEFARFTNLSRFDNIRDTADIAFKTGDAIGSFWLTKTAIGTRNGLKMRVYGSNGSFEWFQQDPEYLLMCDSHGAKLVIDRASDCIEATKPRYERMKAGHPSGFIEAFSNIYEDIFHEYHDFASSPNITNNSQMTSWFSLDLALEGLRFFEECVGLSDY